MTISDQASFYSKNYVSKPPSAIPKIKDVLNFIRNEFFEVPFIAFYRKEHIMPDLNNNDLWKIYEMDEKVSSSSNWTPLSLSIDQRVID